MGTGYVRNDAANNIADGNIINASDLDGEFDAVEAAFNSASGHTHDGTSAEGAPIEVIGPTQDVVITASVMRPKTTNTVDLGTSSLEFKDAYFDGTITTDALTVTDGITSDTVTILSENAGAAKGPQLDIFRDSESPADSDVLGHIDFSGKDDGDNKTIYASILAEAADVTDTTEDGVLKFNTMVAGTDTTIATIDASGLTVDGDATINNSGAIGYGGNLVLTLNDNANDYPMLRFTGTSGGLFAIRSEGSNSLKFYEDTGALLKSRMFIAEGGDISFYEDTGTTAKFFWDASAESLGIGTSSPSSYTTTNFVAAVAGTNYLTVVNTTTGLESQFGSSADGTVIINRSAEPMRFFTNSSERMRIDSSGNVGIGTTSPSQMLHVADASTTVFYYGDKTSGSTAGIALSDAVGSSQVLNTDGELRFKVGGTASTAGTSSTEAMRIDSSGNLLVGATSTSGILGGSSNTGSYLSSDGGLFAARSGDAVLHINRQTSDGEIIELRKDGTTVGSIGAASGKLYISNDTGTGGLRFYNGGINPCDGSGIESDNQRDLGKASSRWDDVYATNGTIQTSDQNEKQQIASLTDAEMTAAKAISKLFKTFKWNDSVAEKGDAARTHAGVIAQQVETAMSDAGLNAGNYAFFISTTWWETQTEVAAVEAVEAQDAVYEDVIIPAVEEVLDEEGNVVTEAQPERTEQRLVSEAVEAVEGKEAYTRTDTYDTLEEAPEGATERNRKGIRYPELLSFIGAATEQRLTSIEARLDALENA